MSQAFDELVRVVKKLRDPNGGCPWDLEQTHATLKPFVIEEAYEVVDAIDLGPAKLKEELGDLLLQVVLHAQIGADNSEFVIDDVVRAITKKLIDRHPHVFGDRKVSGTKEVLSNWEQIKQAERQGKESVIDGVPRSMPALLRAARLGDKAARVGFDWNDASGAKDKVLEELREFFEEEAADASTPRADEELGDLLFALCQWGRKSGKNLEEILSSANDKFTRRFKAMENSATTPLKDLSANELEQLWNLAKVSDESSRKM